MSEFRSCNRRCARRGALGDARYVLPQRACANCRFSMNEMIFLAAYQSFGPLGNATAGFIILAVLVAGGAALLSARGPLSWRAKPPPPPEGLPYVSRGELFSNAERSFYEVLRRAVGAEHCIFAKVRLADLLTVPKGTLAWQAHFNRIQSKHIDFIVCDVACLSPRVALELDDSSHAAPERRERDAFVDRALARAGLPLIRVPARQGYAAPALRDALSAYLTCGVATTVVFAGATPPHEMTDFR